MSACERVSVCACLSVHTCGHGSRPVNAIVRLLFVDVLRDYSDCEQTALFNPITLISECCGPKIFNHIKHLLCCALILGVIVVGAPVFNAIIPIITCVDPLSRNPLAELSPVLRG